MASKVFMIKIRKIAKDLEKKEQKLLLEMQVFGYALTQEVKTHLGFAGNIDLAVVGFDTVAEENHLPICKVYVIGSDDNPKLRVRKSFFDIGHYGIISEILVEDAGEEFTIKTRDRLFKTEREEKFKIRS